MQNLINNQHKYTLVKIKKNTKIERERERESRRVIYVCGCVCDCIVLVDDYVDMFDWQMMVVAFVNFVDYFTHTHIYNLCILYTPLLIIDHNILCCNNRWYLKQIFIDNKEDNQQFLWS